ncbi:hypothetical protein [Terrisporobacter petrolearius]|uniref:hypothetical protein n=1 Tax=Terrisporobacter petrolearius TaxID=1460447 RepID=UPI0031CC45B3
MNQKPSKYLKYVNNIMFILATILVIGGFYKSYKADKIYNKDVSSIIQENHGQYLNSVIEETDDSEIKAKLIDIKYSLFCGRGDSVDVVINKDGEIEIDTYIKSGNLKLLILDKYQNSIFFEEVNNKKIDVNVKAGKYEIIPVGSWFSGKVSIKIPHGE